MVQARQIFGHSNFRGRTTTLETTGHPLRRACRRAQGRIGAGADGRKIAYLGRRETIRVRLRTTQVSRLENRRVHTRIDATAPGRPNLTILFRRENGVVAHPVILKVP